jgi:hypothetical protein
VVESRKREESAERMYQIYASLAFPSKQKELVRMPHEFNIAPTRKT